LAAANSDIKQHRSANMAAAAAANSASALRRRGEAMG
jgi:hypothetical protein